MKNFYAPVNDPGVELAYKVAQDSPELPKESKRTRMRRSYYKAVGAGTVAMISSFAAEPYYSARRENPQSLDMIDHISGNATFNLCMVSCVIAVYFMSEAQTIEFGRTSSTARFHPYLFRNEQTV